MSNEILLKQKSRIEAYCMNPGTSLGGGDDYGTYGYLEWNGSLWTGYAGGTSASDLEPYSMTFSVEKSEVLSKYVEEYLRYELKKAGLENKVNFEKFHPIAKWNLEEMLDQLAEKKIIKKLEQKRYQQEEGTLILLENSYEDD